MKGPCLRTAYVIGLSAILSTMGAATVHAELQGRYLTPDTSNGFDAYYDTEQDMTWLADALYGGRRDWNSADQWVESLRLGGYSDWRLPTVTGSPANPSVGELYYLWVYELGNNSDAQHPTFVHNDGPFYNVEYYISSGAYNPSAAYWTSFHSGDYAAAWMTFNAFYINQVTEGTVYGVWVCRSGDSGWAPAECAPCAADYDQNGGVDGGDLAAFFFDFEAGDTCADVDQNGGVDGGDLAFFFRFFEQGGC